MQIELMREEARRRLKLLIDEYQLSPNVLKYYEENKIYYSYLTASGIIPSIDNVEYDSTYAKQIKSFEKKSGNIVFHAIEADMYGFKTLSLLYVSKYFEEDPHWKYENYIMAYVVNIDKPELSEYGDILINSSEPNGALLRIG